MSEPLLPDLVASFADGDQEDADQDDGGLFHYSVGNVLSIIPKTKQSQVELLVRTGKVIPAWPSPGRGYDRAFNLRNLVEIAIAAELIAMGLVGVQLGRFFRATMRVVFDARAPRDAEYLVLLPSGDNGGYMPLPYLLAPDKLATEIGFWNVACVVNVKNVLRRLLGAIADFHQGLPVEGAVPRDDQQ
jgi:hypothetical protein